MIGQRIVQEALARGHEVTAVARHPEKLAISSPRLHAKAADVDDPKGLAAALAGNDVVLSAYGPGPENFRKLCLRRARCWKGWRGPACRG
jgi:hypothetical protein